MARVSSYFTPGLNLGEKTLKMVRETSGLDYIETSSEFDAFLLEAKLIRQYRPKFNVRTKGSYPYPLIKIDRKKDYPPVLLVREEKEDLGLYFGPFPRVGEVKRLLKFLRRVYPFVSVKNHPRRRCLDNHLGLCPCPPVFGSAPLKREYQKNIKTLVELLSGKSPSLMGKLRREMFKASSREKFEKAAEIKRQLEAINFMRENFRQPEAYLKNPNLLDDTLKEETEKLRQLLILYGYKLKNLQRIEGYDISDLSGQEAVGSMVVFVNGRPEKSHYRRFKIKREGKADDVLMLEEVLRRRFKRWTANKKEGRKSQDESFSEVAHLILVDGGAGQVARAVSVLKEWGLEIPVVGLAKKNEEIVFDSSWPIKRSKRLKTKRRYRIIRLKKKEPALKLLVRIRDEAHRFANAYHRKRRSLLFTQNQLTRPGSMIEDGKLKSKRDIMLG